MSASALNSVAYWMIGFRCANAFTPSHGTELRRAYKSRGVHVSGVPAGILRGGIGRRRGERVGIGQQPVHQRAERRVRGGGGDGLIGQGHVAGIARQGHEMADGEGGALVGGAVRDLHSIRHRFAIFEH
jgi:hypothetical protein